MRTIDIRNKLHHYIETAQKRKVKAIFAMVEEEIVEEYDYWNDKNFIDELQRREKSYLDGTSKAYSLEQTITRARQAVQKSKK